MVKKTNDEEPASKGMRVHDPELQAMQKIDRILAKLPNERSKLRVINWLKDKADFPLVQDAGQ